MRKEINDLLETKYPTYAIGQHKGECNSAYLVLKFNDQSGSSISRKGAFQLFEVLAYTPEASIASLEDMTDDILEVLEGKYEFSGKITQDYHDTEVKAYMRSVQFRKPKGL